MPVAIVPRRRSTARADCSRSSDSIHEIGAASGRDRTATGTDGVGVGSVTIENRMGSPGRARR
ncbi:hypothetical protein A6E15_10155 [Natrinema saccharevitans]|uniref:Uncharacterized protein n=1 Tax=Natrinema saccharevitans TaxID=301967 RepID=A0A1S8AXI6_9EURY|nr:hypothetical protein A6E15_10155 [Natrinema saccharevitans]